MVSTETILNKINNVATEVGSEVRAKQAIIKLIRDYSFDNVLDIGCGPKKHTKIFEHFNKKVVTCDMVEKHNPTFLDNFLNLDNEIKNGSFDCIWASHTLEHQPNIAVFLKMIKEKLKDGGALAITVPPLKHQIVGGHVTLWNMGLLFYNLVAVGFDCSEAVGKFYDYDISVIVRKKDINWNDDKIKKMELIYSTVDDGVLTADGGDFYKLIKYFPKGIPWVPHGIDKSFNGALVSVGNWG